MTSGTLFATLSAAMLAVAYPIYLHILGYETYGVWLVLSTFTAFAQIGNIGVSQALAKLVAEEHATNNQEAIRQYISSALLIVAFPGLLIILAAIFLRSDLIHWLGFSGANAGVVNMLLPWVAFVSVYVFVVDIFNNTLNGLGRSDLCNSCQFIAQFASIFASIVLLLLGFGLKGMLLATAAGYMTSHLVSIRLMLRVSGMVAFIPRQWSKLHTRRLLGFGGWMLASTLLNMLLTPFNRLLLTRFAGVAAVPVYDISFNIPMQLRNLSEAAQRSLTAEVSRLCAGGGSIEKERLRRVLARAKHMLLLSAPLFILLFVAATPLLKLWLGSRFSTEVVIGLRIMAAAAFLNLASAPSYYALMGVGRPQTIFGAFLTQSITNCCVVSFLILNGYRITADRMIGACGLGIGIAAVFLIWRERVYQRHG